MEYKPLIFCSNLYTKNNIPDLNIEWLLTDYCNFDCSYCLIKHKKENINNTNTRVNLNFFKYFVLGFDNIKTPIKYKLSGGEPTSHPDFKSMLYVLKNKEIRIFTNLNLSTKDLEKIAIIPICKSTTFNISLHLEYYKDGDRINLFLSKIKLLIDAGFLISISIIAHPDFFDLLKKIVNLIKTNFENKCWINIIPLVLSTMTTDYSIEYRDYLNKNEMVGDYIFLDNKNNIYKKNISSQEIDKVDWRGYKCFLNLHIFLNKNKIMQYPCMTKHKYNNKFILPKNIEKIKEDIYNPIICNNKTCNCLTLSMIPKIHPDATNEQIDKILPWIKSINPKKI